MARYIELDTLVAEIERRIKEHKRYANSNRNNMIEEDVAILSFINSMQEESVPLIKENSTPLSGGERADSSKQGNSAKKDFRERYKRIAESTEFMSSQDGMSIGEYQNDLELVENPICAYSTSRYTDEDRKILCEGCEEECTYNKKEEPVSEDLEKEIDRWSQEHCYNKSEKLVFAAVARHFANWQKNKDKEQILILKDQIESCHAAMKCKDELMKIKLHEQKEEMMKDAIDTTFYYDGEFLTIDYDFNQLGYKLSDKIKIIIMTKEE